MARCRLISFRKATAASEISLVVTETVEPAPFLFKNAASDFFYLALKNVLKGSPRLIDRERGANEIPRDRV